MKIQNITGIHVKTVSLQYIKVDDSAIIMFFSVSRKVLKEISVGELQPDETVDAMHEARLLSRLNHPGIVKFYDSFIERDFFCIITEYCEVSKL